MTCLSTGGRKIRSAASKGCSRARPLRRQRKPFDEQVALIRTAAEKPPYMYSTGAVFVTASGGRAQFTPHVMIYWPYCSLNDLGVAKSTRHPTQHAAMRKELQRLVSRARDKLRRGDQLGPARTAPDVRRCAGQTGGVVDKRAPPLELSSVPSPARRSWHPGISSTNCTAMAANLQADRSDIDHGMAHGERIGALVVRYAQRDGAN